VGRLSVVPVTPAEWEHLCALGGLADFQHSRKIVLSS
jgi:predicted RNA-binding protein with PUA-like domain